MAGCRLDEARHVEPLETVMTDRDRTLADRRPYAARDRLQVKAMLVRRPDLDDRARVLLALIGCGALEHFS